MSIERTRPPRRRLATALALAGLAAVLLLGSPAPGASASAWNEGTEYLEQPAGDNGKCVRKFINLAGGFYVWKLYIVRPSAPHDPHDFSDWYVFRTGRYLWQDCIGPSPEIHDRAYIHCSWLDEMPVQGNPTRFCHYMTVPPSEVGLHEFGSGLTRTGP